MPANVLITPASGQVDFVGSASGTTSIKTLSDSTLSFEANTGQLFSINSNLSSGKIWSVNDISGLPSLDVDADGTVRVAPFGGTTQIGSSGYKCTIANNGSITAGLVNINSAGVIAPANGLQSTTFGNNSVAGFRDTDTQAFLVNSAFPFGFGSNVTYSATSNPLVLSWCEGNNIWAQRNGANAQTFRIYNTYTDASNYERLKLSWSTNTCTIGIDAAGTGTARQLIIDSGTGTNLSLRSGGVEFLRGVTSGVAAFPINRVSFTSLDFGANVGLNSRAAGVVGINTALSGTGSGNGTLASTPLSPTTLSANQNDYNPGVARRYRLATDGTGAKTITGLSISQVDGQEFSIVNVGTDNITLSHQSASSTAANRFICTGAADIVLNTDQEALVWYDGTTQRFRMRKV